MELLKRTRQRGYALLFALGLIMGLSIVVAATQRQVVQSLAITKTQRDYERALQMAEAGANAYINRIVSGALPNGTANAALVPPITTINSILSAQTFKQQAKDGTIPATSLIYYPAGQTDQGYFAAQIGNAGTNVTVVSYGFSHGVVRRVKIGAVNFSIFDWAALYGIDNLNTNQDYALKFTFSTNIVGTFGSEGAIKISKNEHVNLYDGPEILANGSYGAPFNNVDMPISQSTPGVPLNHVGTGTLANPLYKHFARPLNIRTADDQANLYSGTTQGVEYYRTHNDNNTGIRMLVRDNTTHVIRELPGNYQLIPTSGANAYVLTWPQNATYTAYGMTANETAYGLRIYPGFYFAEAIQMSQSDSFYQRTYNDADRGGFVSGQRLINVQGDPANPNSGESALRDIRFFIGDHTGSGSPPNSTITYQTYMEYPAFASRFRLYSATHGGFTVKGSQSASGFAPFRAAMLAYNKDALGNYYGNIAFQGSTYLYGSLLAWQVQVNGGTTIEKQVEENDGTDQLTFTVTDWSELP